MSSRLCSMTVRGILAVSLFIVVAACGTRQELRGYRFDEDRIAKIKVGEMNQNQVANIMGSPSSVSTFADRNNTWYYISTETEGTAFFRDEIKAQKVVAIDFNEDGQVTQVRRYDLRDGREITPVERETPTKGRELGVLEQFFGNLGRFNRPRPPGT